MPSNVVITVSKSGTMDGMLIIEYIENVIQPIFDNQPPSILVMNDFKEHSVESVIEKLQSLKKAIQ